MRKLKKKCKKFYVFDYAIQFTSSHLKMYGFIHYKDCVWRHKVNKKNVRVQIMKSDGFRNFFITDLAVHSGAGTKLFKQKGFTLL